MQHILFTQSAARKVYELIQEEGKPELKLRVVINGGGCKGLEYGFSFEEDVHEDDIVIYAEIVLDTPEEPTAETGSQTHQVQFLVDPISMQYLVGAEIDYSEKGLKGGQFIIRNPNATTTCGCGSSFSADPKTI